MYPVFRMIWHIARARRERPLAPTETHETGVTCWPWDIDPWMELNNGRTLTLYDLGRIGLGVRIGLVPVLRDNGWSITVAGNSLRYRHRVRAFDRLTMRTRVCCWDARFIYIEQSLWNRAGLCCSQQLLRAAITSPGGIVPTEQVAQALQPGLQSPPVPDWIGAWISADATRPWPPALP